jgi:hypothetical protein
MGDSRKLALQEKARRYLERKHKDKQDDLLKFMEFFYEKERPKGIEQLLIDDYMYILSDALMKVIEKKTRRLIINIPP